MVGLERLLIGRTLGGRYTVEELIGQGRGGLVYRARHAQTGVEVALKVLAAPRTPEARERFRKLVAGEVRAAAAIDHPNVAGVYALAHDAELDLDFVTSELLRGQTLASVLSQRGKPPIALGLRLLSDAAEGLSVGHRAGLVHRDLRPASLYLVRSDTERQVRVKVAGFGVPQIVRRESLANAAPEVSAYASPEMLASGSLRLTPASDVFSLGVIGYELLTGHLPFDEAARRALAEGRGAEAEPPANVAAGVPPQVVEAVIQALHIDPAARPADGAAFAAALQQPSRQVVAVGKIAPAAVQPPESAPVSPAPAAAPEPAPAETPPAAGVAAPVLAAAAAAGVVDVEDLAVDADEPEVPETVAAEAEAPVEEEPPAAATVAEPAATAAPAVTAPPAPERVRTPAPATPVKALGPRTPDLELYYPPQAPKQPVVAPIGAFVAPPAPPAAPPAAPVAQAPVVETPAPVAATPSPAAETPAAETPAAAPAPSQPVLTALQGGAKKRAAAGTGGFRGSAMAAGFVLGILVLGSAAWMATRHNGRAPVSAPATAANQLVSNAAAPAGTAPAQPAAGAQPNAAAPAVTADTAAKTAEQRAAELRKQQEDEQRRQQEQKAREAQLLQQQQLAQANPAAAQPQPAAPAAAPVQQPQPQQQAAAPVQRPAPQVAAAPPPAPAPAREEPAARAPSGNEVYDEDVVEERPRLTNATELQRVLQDRYPAQLYANRVSGRVTASFVVGPDGRVDPSTIRILNSPNQGFNVPTSSVIRRARFRPATVKGQPVRVQVTMPVAWTIDQ